MSRKELEGIKLYYQIFFLLYMEKEYLLIPTDYIHTKKLLKH